MRAWLLGLRGSCPRSRLATRELPRHEQSAGRVNNKRIHRLWVAARRSRCRCKRRKQPLRGLGVAGGAMGPIKPHVVSGL